MTRALLLFSPLGVAVAFALGWPAVARETHLLDFDGDLYSKEIEVRFLARIRDESRFSGPEALSDQIARDLAAAESFFENVSLGEA